MAGQAIIPTNKQDPTGAGRRVKGAQNDFARRLRYAYGEILPLIKSLEYDVIQVNHVDRLLTTAMHISDEHEHKSLVINAAADNDITSLELLITNICDNTYFNCCDIVLNAAFYEYKLNPFELANISNTIDDIINNMFMVDKDGNLVNEQQANDLWFMSQYVEPAYIQGTELEMNNLANQSIAYAATRPSIEALLHSEPYTKRLGLLAAREFELMQGFTNDVVNSTRQILSSGMAAGQSPTVIARSLKKMFDTNPDANGAYHGNQARANRIARTEITGAARKAHWDESQSASQEFGFNSKLMHVSALVPTTRHTHATRHGKLFTTQEVREWYTVTPNMINCLCSQVTVLLDDEGKPLNTRPMKQASKERKERLGV